MKQTEIIMGMPVTVEVTDLNVTKKDLKNIFDYFKYIDKKFSTYKKGSEISMLNGGQMKIGQVSQDMKIILDLSEKTKKETNGFFDIKNNGQIDPSGIVKGWAIWQAAKLLEKAGFNNFYLDVGGDIQVRGHKNQEKWKVGIRNPFNNEEIVKVLVVEDEGVATSGTYERGNHIYNPKTGQKIDYEIVSLSIIGPNVYEADRFATAAFAMGKMGIEFIEKLPGFEAYLINRKGIATMTSGFWKYELS